MKPILQERIFNSALAKMAWDVPVPQTREHIVERKADGIMYKAVVWIVDGDQLVRCSSAHLRLVSTAEQTLCSLRDGEARTFQQVVRELPKRNFVDLVGQPSPIE